METLLRYAYFDVRHFLVFLEDVSEVYGQVVPGLLIKVIWHGLPEPL